jgi:putative hydrolase of the HAD superfamily
MKYSAVIFDLFGTLVYNSSPQESEAILRQMASVLSLPANDIVRLWTETFEERTKGVFKNYQGCIKHICQVLQVPFEYGQIERAAGIRLDMLKRELSMMREGAVEVLSHIKGKGIKTGLITNCPPETELLWRDTPLAPLIDVTVFSSAEGLMKPDVRIYQIATDRLAVSPGECIYIADGIGQELKSASHMRMHPVLIHAYSSDSYDPYREEWNGTVISSLKEVLVLLKSPITFNQSIN